MALKWQTSHLSKNTLFFKNNGKSKPWHTLYKFDRLIELQLGSIPHICILFLPPLPSLLTNKHILIMTIVSLLSLHLVLDHICLQFY